MSLNFWDSAVATLQSWAQGVAPVNSAAFDAVAWVSLGFYLAFAVVALHYALKPWAGKAMAVSIVAATAATLVLRFSLLGSPSYVGEGPLWRFVVLSQYLPWAVLSVGGIYVLYRVAGTSRKKCRAADER